MSELIETLRGMAKAQNGLWVGEVVEVLCVTKRDESMKGLLQFHYPINGLAIVVKVMEEYPYNEYTIEFGGRWWKLVGVRQGLSGMAATLIVKAGEDLWDLYTTIPMRDDVTEEQIREAAARCIANMEELRNRR